MRISSIPISSPSGTPKTLSALGFTARSWDQPWNITRGHVTMAERMPTAVLSTSASLPWPTGPELVIDNVKVPDPLLGGTIGFDSFLDQRLISDGLIVVHRGRKVLERYTNGFLESTHHITHSCSKTLTALLVPWAIDNTELTVDRPVIDFLDELAPLPSWGSVTLQQLLDMTAGFDSEEHYEESNSMYWRYAEAVGYYGENENLSGVLDFVEKELTRRVAEPGTVFNYASYLSNLIPIIIERAAGRDYLTLLHENLFHELGAEAPALINVDSHGRPIVEGHVNLTLRDFARWAYLLANGGKNLADKQVIPAWWIDEAFTPSALRNQAFERSDFASVFPGAQYHNQAWLLDPETQCLALLGIHGQFAYVDRANELMIVGLSSFPGQANALVSAYMQIAWSAIVKELK